MSAGDIVGESLQVHKCTPVHYPLHPSTEALLAAVPIPNPQLKCKKRLQGDVPSPINPPGCTSHTRCHYAEARCRIDVPALREVSPGHIVACHLR